MALAERRQAARQARRFQEADSIRDQIAEAGWDVSDSSTGFGLTPRAASLAVFDSEEEVPVRAADADDCRHSLCIAYHGWPADVLRLLTTVCAGAPPGSLEVILGIADGAEDPPPELLGLDLPALRRRPSAVRVRGAGQAQAYNAAIKQAGGTVIHVVEPSLQFRHEVLVAAEATLRDPAVGATGPFGLDTEDWRDFHPSPGPDVAALEYLVSFRRGDLLRIGPMDVAFRYYRNLDLDFSRQVVAAGFSLRVYRAEVTRHVHRLWDSTDAADRERLSRRNFNRMLDRWVRRGEGSSAPPPA
ncbi:MAG: glycosyltransferase family 2 protein [Candidatus Dormibacteria bacterium]